MLCEQGGFSEYYFESRSCLVKEDVEIESAQGHNTFLSLSLSHKMNVYIYMHMWLIEAVGRLTPI